MRRRIPSLAGLLAFASLSATAVWGALYLAAPVSFDRDGDTPIHVLPVNGNLVLCNQVELDASGGVRALTVNPSTHIAPQIVRNTQWTIGDLEFRYSDFGVHGAMWMVMIPKLAPIACIAFAVLVWNWERHRQIRAARASSLAEFEGRQPQLDP